MKFGGYRFAWSLRLVAIALLLTGMLAAIAQPVAAQSGDNPGLVSDTEYKSPNYDFTLTWQAPWQVTEGSVVSSANTGDGIELQSDGAFVQFSLIDSTLAPADALQNLINSSQSADSVSDFTVVGNDSGDGYAAATADYTFTSGGQSFDLRQYYEVESIDGSSGSGGALLGGEFWSLKTTFADQWTSLNENVTRKGSDTIFLGTPKGVSAASKPTPTKTTTKKTPTTKKSPTAKSGNAKPGITGNSYLGANFGFSVTWDDSVWQAEDDGTDTEDALVLTSNSAVIQIRSYQKDGATVRTCVTDETNSVKSADGVSDFVRASSDEKLPDLPDGAYARLYSYTYDTGKGTVDALEYFECRPLTDGAFLLVSYLTTADNYEAGLADYQDVIDTLTLAGESTTNSSKTTPTETSDNGNIFSKIGKESSPEKSPTAEATEATGQTTTGQSKPKLTATKYTGGAYAWSVTWDKAIWTPTALEPQDGYEGVELESDPDLVWVEAFDGYQGKPDDCLSDAADSLSKADGVSDVAEATDLDLPKTVRTASTGLYTYTYTDTSSSNSQPVTLVEYIECRELVKGSAVLRVTMITRDDQYAGQLQDLSALLAGIKLGSTSSSSSSTGTNSSSSGNNSTNSSGTNSSGTSSKLPGVKGRAYTSPNFDFSLTWDNTWTAVSASSDDSGSLLTLSNGTSTVFVLGSAKYPTTPSDCVDAVASVVGGVNGVSNFKPETDSNGNPNAGGDNTYAFEVYDFTQSGTNYTDFIYCQPSTTGNFVVALVDQIPADSFVTEAISLQPLINALTIDGQSNT